MHIRILSDLHCEFTYNFTGSPYIIPSHKLDKETVLILAGDIWSKVRVIKEYDSKDSWLSDLSSRFYKVIYVFGNHDYWKTDLHDSVVKVRNYIKDNQLDNVFLLQDNTVIIDGVKFIGSTLWTSFNNYNPNLMLMAQGMMNDYRMIRIHSHKRNITPDDIFNEHVKSKMYIEQELKKDFDGKIVVVTHHTPSSRSIAPEFVNDSLNGCYHSSLEDLMDNDNVVLWCHGHVHNSFDYKIYGCRVVCNPKGYHGHENINYDPFKLITLN